MGKFDNNTKKETALKNPILYAKFLVTMYTILVTTSDLRSAQEPRNTEDVRITTLRKAEARVLEAQQRLETAQAKQKDWLKWKQFKLDSLNCLEFGLRDDNYERLQNLEIESKLTKAKTELGNAEFHVKEARKLLTLTLQTCSYCKTQGYDLKKCTGCQATYYCSAECQQQDWPRHKQTEWLCPICLCYDDCPRTPLTCKHQFHTRCFKEWQSSGGDNCPLCRAQYIERICAYCRQTGYDFKRCSQCKRTFYCSTSCQRSDWSNHKILCTN